MLSNEKEDSLWLYIATPKMNLGWAKSWTYKVRESKRPGAPVSDPARTNAASQHAGSEIGAPTEIPAFVRSGPQRNNGAWFHHGQLFVQNEDPAHLSAATIDIRGHDIRFKPDTGELELVAGQTQFGRHRDNWGNWFGNNNPNWLWQEPRRRGCKRSAQWMVWMRSIWVL